MRSALYRGRVEHVRDGPVQHGFGYRHTLLALDLDELERVFSGVPFASLERPNLVSFRRRDYLGDARVPLVDAVRARVRGTCPDLGEGPITLLTQPRVLGLVFNPVSFYLLHQPADDGLQAIVAEITNTPWLERHDYVLPVARAERVGGRLRFRFDKAFHVSPFLPMELEYEWEFGAFGEAFDVEMRCRREGRLALRAAYSGRRAPLTARSLASSLASQPAFSLSVLASIYLQALLLRLKGAPFHDHPARRAARAAAPR